MRWWIAFRILPHLLFAVLLTCTITGCEESSTVDPGDPGGDEKCIDYRQFLQYAGISDPLGESPRDVVILGDMAITIAGRGRMDFVDISTPGSPLNRGSIELGASENYSEVAISGPHALVVGNRLHVVDVEDSYPPAVLTSADLGGSGIAVAGGIAVIVGFESRVVDISEPSAPTQMGTLPIEGPAYDVALKLPYAYVIANGASLEIFDISDPTRPVPTGSVALSDAEGVFLGQNVAIVSRGRSGISILSLADLETPTLLEHIESPVDVSDAVLLDDQLLVVASHMGIRVLTLDSTYRPSSEASFRSRGFGRIAIHADLVAMTEGGGTASPRIFTVLLSALRKPSLTGTVAIPNASDGDLNCMEIVGPRLYLGDMDGLHVFDVSEPKTPMLLGSHEGLEVYTICVDGEVAALGSRNELVLVDVSEPAVMAEVSSLDGIRFPRDVVYRDDWAFVLEHGLDGGLRIIDFSDRQNPVISDSTEIAWPSTLWVGETEALVLAAPTSYFVRLSGGTQIESVQRLQSRNTFSDVCVRGRTAYLSGRDAIHLLDLDSGSLTSSVPVSVPYVGQLLVHGSIAYSGGFHLKALSLGDTAPGTLVSYLIPESLRSGEVRDIAFSGGFLFAAGRWTGVHVLELQCDE